MSRKLTLEEGINILSQGISKAMMILDGYPTTRLFTCEHYMNLYDCVYQLCVQQPPYEYSAHLYQLFNKALVDSITSRVMPAVKDKTQYHLLYEVWNMWTRYKAMAKVLGGFFLYLDRQFTKDTNAASLTQLSVSCFRDMVVSELYPDIIEAAISLVNQDREGNSVNRDMLKNVSTLFVEIESGNMQYYESFETAMLTSTATYYNHLLPQWLLHYSPVDIFMKAQNCLNQEKERASQFLHETSVQKLLTVVHEQLLGQTALDLAKLYEKQKNEYGDCSIQYQEVLSGCAGLNLGEGSSRV